ETSNYVLELPDELAKRGIHPRFHVSKLRPHIANDDALFPNRRLADPYDWGVPDDAEWVVDEVIGHEWNGNRIRFHIKWNMGDTT
ncbi:hypothetical protein PLEOSDRAFT_1030735, partial [Pleurotus ostreatus PC15]